MIPFVMAVNIVLIAFLTNMVNAPSALTLLVIIGAIATIDTIGGRIVIGKPADIARLQGDDVGSARWVAQQPGYLPPDSNERVGE